MGRISPYIKALYAALAAILQSHMRWGSNIYEDDWDVLIILDACRVDAIQAVQNEYPFLDTIDTRWSLGSTSKEWLENTFVEKYRQEIESTAYVTPNPFSEHLQNSDGRRVEYTATEDTPIENNQFLSDLVRDDLVPAADFGEFIGLFGMTDNDGISQLHPEKVTDSAIRTHRTDDCTRTIVHYMQPHRPYLDTDDSHPWKKRPFGYLNDDGDFENVWSAYLDNLRLVLDHVEILLENMDAETVVITSDHGELFGELGLYSHEVGIPHPAVRKVPWVETTARDTESRNPEPVTTDETASESEIQERLEALGYR